MTSTGKRRRLNRDNRTAPQVAALLIPPRLMQQCPGSCQLHSTLDPDPEIATVTAQDLGQSLGIGRCRAAPQAAALLIHDTDRGLLCETFRPG